MLFSAILNVCIAAESMDNGSKSLLDTCPLYFIKNEGQINEDVNYYVLGKNKNLYFDVTGLKIICRKRINEIQQKWIINIEYYNANKKYELKGVNKIKSVFNLFKFNKNKWFNDIKAYNKLIYNNIWNNVDLVYSGSQNEIKYKFIVRPSADIKNISLKVDGSTTVVISGDGGLNISTPLGMIVDGAPKAFQSIDGKIYDIPISYFIRKDDLSNSYYIGFDVGIFDNDEPLIIDPCLLVYSGFIGGSESDKSFSVATDNEGNAYVVGNTLSYESSFPVQVGPYITHSTETDAYIAKISNNGSCLEYCGFIGGEGDESAFDVAVDNDGCAYIVGSTKSEENSFPVKNGPYISFSGEEDAFIAKVNAQGADLEYCGYIGGKFYDRCYGIDLDNNGNAYIVGITNSSEYSFPVKVGPEMYFSGNYDAFIARVNANGTSLDYCGYIGGNNFDIGKGVAIDANGNAYMVGYTKSYESTFPVLLGPDLTFNGDEYDAFVCKVKYDGSNIEYCGYLGGDKNDYGYDIDVDKEGNVYLVGSTHSNEITFPIVKGPSLTHSGYSDVFVSKLNTEGSAYEYCGYIGGDLFDEGLSIKIDKQGCAYVAGSTMSDETSFPVKVGPNLKHSGAFDAFFAKVSKSGDEIVTCGYVGGEYSENCYGICLDKYSNLFITGDTQSTESSFPVIGGPDLTYNGGSGDVFIVKIAMALSVDNHTVKISGDTVNFDLQAGIVNAKRNYLLLGSVSGTNPGFPLPGGVVELPLHWDPFTDLVLLFLNTPVFCNFMGELSSYGSQNAQMKIPSLPTSSIGVKIYFAYCINNPFNFISNPVEIEVIQ
jgi:hypothetical protein